MAPSSFRRRQLVYDVPLCRRAHIVLEPRKSISKLTLAQKIDVQSQDEHVGCERVEGASSIVMFRKVAPPPSSVTALERTRSLAELSTKKSTPRVSIPYWPDIESTNRQGSSAGELESC
jgi:hypothetical protein